MWLLKNVSESSWPIVNIPGSALMLGTQPDDFVPDSVAAKEPAAAAAAHVC